MTVYTGFIRDCKHLLAQSLLSYLAIRYSDERMVHMYSFYSFWLCDWIAIAMRQLASTLICNDTNRTDPSCVCVMCDVLLHCALHCVKCGVGVRTGLSVSHQRVANLHRDEAFTRRARVCSWCSWCYSTMSATSAMSVTLDIPTHSPSSQISFSLILSLFPIITSIMSLLLRQVLAGPHITVYFNHLPSRQLKLLTS